MKKIYLILVWGLVFCEGYSQNPLVKQWDKRFGGTDDDQLSAMPVQTKDGGYILGGVSYSDSSGDKTQPDWDPSLTTYDYWVIKMDSLGIKQWDKRFGGTNNDFLTCLQQTADGGYIFGGYSMSGIDGDKTQSNWGSWDYWIVKTDSVGNTQWNKDFGGSGTDRLYSLQQTIDGGYILGGYSNSGISGDKTQTTWAGSVDYWIVKTDALGIKQWDKDFGGTSSDVLYSLQQAADGGYILGGNSTSGIGGNKTQVNWGVSDYWIIKTDSLGTKQWDKDFGGTIGDDFNSLQQTADGGYILGGLSYSGIGGNKTQASWGFRDYWIVKTDSLGSKQWDKDFGGTDDENQFGNVFQAADKGYLVAGLSLSNISGDKTENNIGSEQTWVVKTDSLGNKQWDKTLLENGETEEGFAIQTKDGCYAMADFNDAPISGDKSQDSWDGTVDYWIIKLCDTTAATNSPTLTLPVGKGIRIYPNPATGNIQLAFNTKHNAQVHCEIRNVMGEIVWASPLTPLWGRGESYATLDVSFLTKGIYLVRIGDACLPDRQGESWESRKLVVE